MGRPKQDPVERLHQDVKAARGDRSTSACWPWQKSLDTDGYGQCYMAELGGVMKAHRAVYTQLIGPIQAGFVVMHACDNPRCVNPAHLSVGTVADNNVDCLQKGRQPSRRGTHNPMVKLTAKAVSSIRRADLSVRGASRRLAEQLGVSAALITRIRNNELWRHV